jgi:U3 small nucleolar RNA-associated protein 7
MQSNIPMRPQVARGRSLQPDGRQKQRRRRLAQPPLPAPASFRAACRLSSALCAPAGRSPLYQVRAQQAKATLTAPHLSPPTHRRKRPKPDAYLAAVGDRKLKGQLRYSERLFAESSRAGAKVGEWLAPGEAGALEAEGGWGRLRGSGVGHLDAIWCGAAMGGKGRDLPPRSQCKPQTSNPTKRDPFTGAEETWQFKQQDIAQAVAVGAASKAFDLQLPELGPYSASYTRSGRHLLLGGRRGHLAVMEWQRQRLVCEVQVAETTRAVTFLHNEQFWAAAQKKYVYIYDKRGLEVHCLKDHTQPAALEFLPHHFLLASVGEPGVLNYQVGWLFFAGGGSVG